MYACGTYCWFCDGCWFWVVFPYKNVFEAWLWAIHHYFVEKVVALGGQGVAAAGRVGSMWQGTNHCSNCCLFVSPKLWLTCDFMFKTVIFTTIGIYVKEKKHKKSGLWVFYVE